MRYLTCAFVLVSLGLGAVSCKDEGPTLAATARWRLRCPVDGAGCFDNERAPHAVSARRGDTDAIVSCDSIDISGGNRAVSMDFQDATGQLTIENVVVNSVGGVVVAPGCQVTIWDNNGDLFGPFHCGPEAPSTAQPCQITTLTTEDSGSLALDDGAVSGRVFSTTIRCNDIQDASGDTRHLVSPDSPPPNLMPAPISVVNCDGF